MIKGIGAVIYRKYSDEIKYLLTLKYKGYWEMTKGKVEENEEEMETLEREIKEELGNFHYNVINGFKEKANYPVGDEQKEVTYYLVETRQEKFNISDEHKEYKWVKYEDALNCLDFDTMRNVLIKANEFLTNK